MSAPDEGRLPPPTPGQLRVLRAIEVLHGREESGRPPTWRELRAELGFTTNSTLSEHLKKLQRAGCIAVDALETRGVRILERGRRYLRRAQSNA